MFEPFKPAERQAAASNLAPALPSHEQQQASSQQAQSLAEILRTVSSLTQQLLGHQVSAPGEASLFPILSIQICAKYQRLAS